MSEQVIIREQDIVQGKSDTEILMIMRSSQKSLAGSGIIDEDNQLFYVDPALESINDELHSYFYEETVYKEITSNDIRERVAVYQGKDKDLYAIWNN